MGQIIGVSKTDLPVSHLHVRLNSLRKHYDSSVQAKWEAEVELYRMGYPDKPDDPSKNLNYLFYTNQIACQPEGLLIDNILSHWCEDYDRIEAAGGVVNWLFPVREDDEKNGLFQELHKHESQKMQQDPDAMKRLISAYKLFLGFFGMTLVDEQTGAVGRAFNWRARFPPINSASQENTSHDHITRMLKCLGELGLANYQRSFIEFIFKEALCYNTLSKVLFRCVYCWLPLLRDSRQRFVMKSYAEYLASSPTRGALLDLNAKYQPRVRWSDTDSGTFSGEE